MDPEVTLKIKVTVGGDITADGQPVTLDQLADKLADLKSAGGCVWYHRENPEAEPHPNAVEVIDKVIDLAAKNRLPIRLSAKPDFSDAVVPSGFPSSGEK